MMLGKKFVPTTVLAMWFAMHTIQIIINAKKSFSTLIVAAMEMYLAPKKNVNDYVIVHFSVDFK